MPYSLHRATLRIHTPFGTPLAGDTLFGQLCWALRDARGEAELTLRLAGYTEGRPWLVVSDGFPARHLPRPTLPQHFGTRESDPIKRKAARKQRWIPVPTSDALTRCLQTPAADLPTADDTAVFSEHRVPQHGVQMHNTINRLTGTTGEGEFAPYTQALIQYARDQQMDLYLVLDDERTTPDELATLLTAIGATGFGRDASTGLGKFTLESLDRLTLPGTARANAWWTLAPCAPQGQGFDDTRSYWRVITRFGRHGNTHALSGKPFKNPVLLASTGAVFCPVSGVDNRLFIGQGLGGRGQISKAEPATVHQGYAPVLPIEMKDTA